MLRQCWRVLNSVVILNNVRKTLLINSANQNSIVFIDEIHTVMGAGAGTNGGLDLANILNHTLLVARCVALVLLHLTNIKLLSRKNKAMVRRFTNYTITEPSKKHMMEIMGCDTYGAFHGVE